MQPWHRAPAHPSLPIAPHVQDTQHPWQYGMSSHYAQAYMQYSYQGRPQQLPSAVPQASTSRVQLHNPPPSAKWYQPGSVHCKKQGCSFTGSQKAVEIHMMDRHLIYPPGWVHRKKKDDWDADPSLKGKEIPIQGTTIKLDTPEAIEQWIAERKKRFPTAARVEEKRQKMQEAAARGQLAFPEQRFPNKKRRLDGERLYVPGRGSTRGHPRGRGRGSWTHAQRMQDRVHTTPANTVASVQSSDIPATHGLKIANLPQDGDGAMPEEDANDSDSSESASDSDAPPEVASSKLSDTRQQGDGINPDNDEYARTVPKAIRKPLPKQPRRPPQNPFASRPALLRNLLLPEIRMTVSNLSQAIRFLVDNDFLENVELTPGQAERKMIEVVNESLDGVDIPQPVTTTERPHSEL